MHKKCWLFHKDFFFQRQTGPQSLCSLLFVKGWSIAGSSSVKSATRLHLEEESDEAFQEIRNTFALRPCDSRNVIWCRINNHSIVELEVSPLCAVTLSLEINNPPGSGCERHLFAVLRNYFWKCSQLHSFLGHAPSDNSLRCSLKIKRSIVEFF